MKVKDLSQPLLSGRMGNLIYYVRNGVQCVRRAEVPGKKRKKERSDQQKGVTGRFAIVQAFYAAYCRQVSRDIWRAAARAEGKMAHNLFNSTNCRCFSGEGKLVDFVNFTFTKGSLLLPRGLKIEQVEGTERRVRGLAGRARMGHSNRERPPANRCIVRFPAVRTTAGSERIGQAAGFVRRIHTVGTGNRRRTRVLLFCPRRRKRLFGLSIFPDQCHPLSSTAYNMNVMK